MEDISVSFLNQVQFFRFLKWCFHGNQFCGKIVAKLTTPCTYRYVIPKRNWISATSMSALTAYMMPLYCVKFFGNSVQ